MYTHGCFLFTPPEFIEDLSCVNSGAAVEVLGFDASTVANPHRQPGAADSQLIELLSYCRILFAGVLLQLLVEMDEMECWSRKLPNTKNLCPSV